MKITSIDAFAFRLPLRRPFSWASLQVDLGGFVAVRIDTDAGLTGWGEATPLPDWGGDHGVPGGETQAGVIDVVKGTIAPTLLGEDPCNVTSAHLRIDRVLRGNSYARCAVDIALHDLWGKALGQPIHRLLGGRARDRVPVAHMIGLMPTEEALEEAEAVLSDEIAAFQVKGGQDAATDRATVTALRERAPDAFLRLDANQGYGTAKRAARLLAPMQDALDMVEQPVRDLAEMADLRERTPIDLIADESCWSDHDALALTHRRAADAVSIYLAKSGGFGAARRVAAIARAAGLPCDVNGSIESAIGTAANVHFALAEPAVTLPAVIAMSAPAGRSASRAGFYYTDDVSAEALPRGPGGLGPLDAPGLGIEVVEAQLDRYREAPR